MAYDEKLAERIRTCLTARRIRFEKQKMFGGIAFMVDGRMCAGVMRDELMVRTGPEAQPTLLTRRHTRVMDFTRRPMNGFLVVAPAGVRTAAALDRWLAAGVEYVRSLPPKTLSRSKTPSRRRTRS